MSVGAGLVVISTNEEVFDGSRTDGLPYSPTEPPSPANPYGASKLAGETIARVAFLATGLDFNAAALAEDGNEQASPLAIVRTAWLFGRPGIDFPAKILAAAERARDQHRSLALVSDEIGTPTYAPDLASAIVRLLGEAARPGGRGFGGIHHVVNGGQASRAAWAREVLRLAGIDVATNDVPSTTWPAPPRHRPGECSRRRRAARSAGPLRDWAVALAGHMALQTSNEEAGR